METLNVPFKPWEYMTYRKVKTVKTRVRGVSGLHAYNAIFETLKNYDSSHWKPGDVIRFGDGLNFSARDRWETWFLHGEDKKRFAKENKIYDRRIPAYARSQYAMVLGRYKWTKCKHTTYVDYGSFIMMLTGEKVGHVRKYYVFTPWTEIGSYPYTQMRYNLKPEKIFHGVPIGNNPIHFLENITKELIHAS